MSCIIHGYSEYRSCKLLDRCKTLRAATSHAPKGKTRHDQRLDGPADGLVQPDWFGRRPTASPASNSTANLREVLHGNAQAFAKESLTTIVSTIKTWLNCLCSSFARASLYRVGTVFKPADSRRKATEAWNPGFPMPPSPPPKTDNFRRHIRETFAKRPTSTAEARACADVITEEVALSLICFGNIDSSANLYRTPH